MAAAALRRAGSLLWPLGPAARLRLATLAALWLIWELLGASGLVYPGVLPSWIVILGALARLLASPEFWFHLSVTGLEIGLALTIGTVLGLVVGIPLGTSRWLGPALERYVHYVASTPKVVFMPLVFILFGIGPSAKIAIGAFACSFPVTLGTASAMRQIPPVLIRVGRSFGLGGWQMVRMIYLPALMRPIVTGVRIALGIAFAACLIAEMRVGNTDLGSLVVTSYERARFPEIYAVLMVTIGFAAGANALLTRLARRLEHRHRLASL